MNIQDAIRQFRDIGPSDDPQFDPVIRRSTWDHGRILIPTREDFYARIVGRYPALPVHITLTPDDVMSEDWEVTVLSRVLLENEEKKTRARTGRRMTVEQ